MLIFNCTKGAQDFFTVTRKGKKQTIVEAPPSKDMSEDIKHLKGESESPPRIQQWMLHAITIKRKHCLVAVEVETRFAIILTGVKKANREEFLQLFKTYLTTQLLKYAGEQGIWGMADTKSIIENTLEHFADTHFFRRYDSNVQARINRIVQDLRYWVDEDPRLLTDENMLLNVNWFSNRAMCKSKAYPERLYIYPFQEMLLVWQELYRNATPEQVAETRQRLDDIEKGRMEGIIGNISESMQSSGAQEQSVAPSESEMITVSSEVLSHEDMDFLHSALQKYETEVSLESVSSLHGFLTAIVSGPSVLMPSVWMPQIWGGEERQPEWESMKEIERFTGAVFNMMSNISETLMNTPQNFDAVFMGDEHNTDVSDWCTGYMDGIELDEEAWGNLPEELSDKVDFLDRNALMLSVSGSVSPSEQQFLNDEVISSAQTLHAYWLKQRSPQSSSSDRPIPDNVVPIRPQQPANSQKVGRNEPCPCGSGKKFKKCCLH